jgi:peptide deformylase
MAGILSKRLEIPPGMVSRVLKLSDANISPLLLPYTRNLTFSKRFLQFVLPSLKKTAASHGLVSLATNQLGLYGNAFVVRDDWKEGVWEDYEKNEAFEEKFKVFINPQVIKSQESEEIDDQWEYCPSLPLVQALCCRKREIKIKYQDFNGNEQEFYANGFLARVIQHEIDHLSGNLMITTLASEGRIRTTDPRLENHFEDFKQEIDKRYKHLSQLFDNNPKARRNILRLKGEKEESIKRIIFTKALNAHFIAKIHNAVSGEKLDIPEFKDEEYKNFLQNLR